MQKVSWYVWPIVHRSKNFLVNRWYTPDFLGSKIGKKILQRDNDDNRVIYSNS